MSVEASAAGGAAPARSGARTSRPLNLPRSPRSLGKRLVSGVRGGVAPTTTISLIHQLNQALQPEGDRGRGGVRRSQHARIRSFADFEAAATDIVDQSGGEIVRMLTRVVVEAQSPLVYLAIELLARLCSASRADGTSAARDALWEPSLGFPHVAIGILQVGGYEEVARTLALLLCLTADEREVRRLGPVAPLQLWSKRGWRVLLQLAGIRKLSAGRVAPCAAEEGDGCVGDGESGGRGEKGKGSEAGRGGSGGGDGAAGTAAEEEERRRESEEDEQLRLAMRHVRPALTLISRGIAFAPCRRILLRHFSSAAAAAVAAEAWAAATVVDREGEGKGEEEGNISSSSSSSISKPTRMLVCIEDVLAEREAAAAAAAAAAGAGKRRGGGGGGGGGRGGLGQAHGADLARQIRDALAL